MLPAVRLSVVVITHNEEANIGRTLASVQPLVAGDTGEVVVVDSGSTDRTIDIAKSLGAKVFVEEWKGYAAQKNSAIEKAQGDWILSLDADEEVEPGLAPLVIQAIQAGSADGYWIQRRNMFLRRWIQHGGFWPDPKLRLFRRGSAQFENRAVHEDVKLNGTAGQIDGALIHHSYPTLSDYIDHMNRYSSLGAEMAITEGKGGFSFLNIAVRPWLTFVYNYFLRLGFLDGREGLLLHLYHAVYVSWKYAKVWELSRSVAGQTSAKE